MRTILEVVQAGGGTLLGLLSGGMLGAMVREGWRAHIVDVSPMGPVGSSGGLDAGGAGRVRVGARSAVTGRLSGVYGARHRAGGRRWSVRAMLRRGERRVTDMGVSAALTVWRVRRDALIMRRNLLAVDTLSTMEWALCMEVTA